MSYGRYDIVVKGLRLGDNWIPINTPLSSCADYSWFSLLLWFDTKTCKLRMKIVCNSAVLTWANRSKLIDRNTIRGREREREREEWKQESWWLRVNDPIFCNKRMVFVNKPKFVMVWHCYWSCLGCNKIGLKELVLKQEKNKNQLSISITH